MKSDTGALMRRQLHFVGRGLGVPPGESRHALSALALVLELLKKLPDLRSGAQSRWATR